MEEACTGKRVEVGKLVQAKEWRWESLNKKKSRDGKACTDKRVEVGKLVPVGKRPGGRKVCTGERVELIRTLQQFFLGDVYHYIYINQFYTRENSEYTFTDTVTNRLLSTSNN